MHRDNENLNPYFSCTNEMRAADAVQFRAPDAGKEFYPGISVVILNLDKPQLICPLVKELTRAQAELASNNISMEIVIGDTGSKHPDVGVCYGAAQKSIKVQRNLNYHFSKNNNELFKSLVTRDLTLFMNNDIVFKGNAADALARVVRHFKDNASTGILGASLLYGDEQHVQHCGISFFQTGPLKGLSYHPRHKEKIAGFKGLEGLIWKVPAVTGAFLCIRSEVFQNLGGFDEAYRTECQDVDLCLMARSLGIDIELMLTGNIIHLENATRDKGSADWADRQTFVRRWGSFAAGLS